MKWPELTDEQAAALKAEHSGDNLTRTRIKMPRQVGGVLTIVWAAPTYDDWDAAASAESDNNDSSIGRRAWADALIRWPTDPAVIGAFVELPFAFNNEWMQKGIMPFFGNGATSESEPL